MKSKQNRNASKLAAAMSLTVAVLVGGGAVVAAAEAPVGEAAMQRQITVKGVVVDAQGLPVPGAGVVQKGTTNGAMTAEDGTFSIEVPAGSILQVNCIGYADTEVAASANVRIVLQESSEYLNELVVVGFGTQRKENLTGAVSSVNVSRVFDSKPIVNVEKGLQGVVPGLQITYTTNDQDAAATIKVRGTGSINGSNKPLVLLDGVEIPDLTFVNPNNIENISILKDAASASIYGARAAYGVVLITSKDGSNLKDNVSISYSNNFSWQQPINLPKYATGYDVLDVMDETMLAKKNTDGTDIEGFGMYYKDLKEPIRNWLDKYYGQDLGPVMKYGRDYTYTAAGTLQSYRVWDPNKEMIKDAAFQHTHNLAITGNSGKTNYNISASYNKTDGLIKAAQEQYLQRITANISTNTQLYKWLNVGTRVMYTDKLQKYPRGYDSSSSSGGLWYYAMRFPTFFPYGISDGAFDETTGSYLNEKTKSGEGLYFRQGNGMVAYAPTESSKNEYLTIGANVRINFTDNFSLYADYTRGQLNYLNKTREQIEYNANFWNSWSPKEAVRSNDQLEHTWLKQVSNTFNAYFDYALNLKNDHHFNFKLGMNTEDLTYNSNYIKSLGVLNTNLPTLNLTNGKNEASVNEVLKDRATAGFFARINYDYKGKYLLEVNGRYDGSSLFRAGDKWAFFPSFSAGYRISEESFFEPLKATVSNLKIRGSYGTIGNQDIDDNWYPFLSTLSTTSYNWVTSDGLLASGVTMPGVLGSSMTWEKIETLDLGLDLGLLNGELNVVFDWYQRVNKDMLVPRNAISQVAGVATLPKENSGNLKTNGWDLQIDYNHVFANDLILYATATVADSKSKISKWNTSTGLLTGNYEGKILGEVWGFKTADSYFTASEVANGVQTAKGLVSIKDYQGNLQSGNFVYGEGDVKYQDLDNDGSVNSGEGTIDNHGDLIRIGNTTPRYEYSLRLGSMWKGFDVEVLFQGVGERSAWLTTSVLLPHFEGAQMGVFTDQLDYYTPENPDARFPRPYIGHSGGKANGLSSGYGSNNFYPQTKYLANLAYLRLKNLTVGYTIPNKLTQKISVSKARIYFSAENLLTFDHLNKAMDPESLGGWNTTSDIDVSYAGRSTPFCRQWSFGIQVSF